jgi:NADH:ubiquinone oxidoreductase subunit 6 (subunit J)
MTDVTFIYIVYILAFVSAVVMLFLSVVLMLPSSAIAVSKRNFSLMLLSAIATDHETSTVTTIFDIAKSFLFMAFLAHLVFSFMAS